MNSLSDGTVPLIAGTMLVTLLAAFIIGFVILYRKAQLQFQLERQQFEQALLQAEVEVREQALIDISRDLHDNFGQIASLIKINLSMLSPEGQDETRVRESIQLLKRLIDDIKSLSTSLNSSNFKEKGLVTMIKNDLERINRSGFIEAQLLHHPEEVSLDPQISIVLYRMFQEMIHNTLKHSKATLTKVSIYDDQEAFALHVSDNGIGIPRELTDVGANETPQGNGLKNIRERTKIIGGRCTIESSPGKGTFIEILLPKDNYVAS